MKKLYLMILMTVLLVSTGFSVTQHELLRYEFEEGGGSVILDSSGNGFTGIQTGVSWTTNNVNGVYATEFDGSNDYIDVLSGSSTPEWLFISFWMDVDLAGSGKETIYNINGVDERYIYYIDYDDNGHIKIDYIDESLNPQTITVINVTMDSNWNHYVFGINANENKFCSWRNNVQTCFENATTGIYRDNSIKTLKIGADYTSVYSDFDGRIDSYRMFDFLINDSQRLELYTTNTITLAIDETEPEINETEKLNIINSYSPVNDSNESSIVNFQASLNYQSTCSLYINNNLEETFNDVLAFNYQKTFTNTGEYSYFIYCEYIDESNVKYYQLLNTTYFNVQEISEATLNFYVSGTDFNINDIEAYLITPCLQDKIIYMEKPELYTEIASKEPIKFTKIINGQAIVDVPIGEHEFCLLNGRVTYDTTNFTENFNINEVSGLIKLGVFDLPNNISTSYNIGVEEFDVYSIYNPKAYGQSWAGLMGALILFLIGVAIAFTGAYLKNGKITIAGVLVILSSFGISIVGVLAMVV